MIQANGKEEDTKAEALLRELLEALQKPVSSIKPNKSLVDAFHHGHWYLQAKDACEFKDDNGNGCSLPAVRVSFSIPCCEEHARMRDRSLK